VERHQLSCAILERIMSLPRTLAVLGLFGGLLVATTIGASACGCGTPHTVRFTSGSSPAGEAWRVDAYRLGRTVFFDTSVRGQPDNGLTISVRRRGLLGPCRAALLSGDYRSGWHEVSGPVDRSVVRVDVGLLEGGHLRVTPRLAPARVRHVRRWLRPFRWASLFAAKEQTPVSVTAFDREGKVVTRLHQDRGLFLCPGERAPHG
jgi:hypothetical protein